MSGQVEHRGDNYEKMDNSNAVRSILLQTEREMQSPMVLTILTVCSHCNVCVFFLE